MTGQGLLPQIAENVLDESVPLASLLRKCLMLGALNGSEQLRTWATLELEGYVGVQELPKHRKIPAAMDLFITNRAGYGGLTQRLQPSVLPKEIFGDVDIEIATISQGVGELEAMAASGKEKHQHSPRWSHIVVEYLNRFHADDSSLVAVAYWAIYPTSVAGVLSEIRTALVALVAELVAQTPEGQTVPDKATTDRAVQILIYGNHNSVTLQQSGDGSINASATVVGEGAATAVGSQTIEGNHSTAVAERDSSASQESVSENWWTGTPQAQSGDNHRYLDRRARRRSHMAWSGHHGTPSSRGVSCQSALQRGAQTLDALRRGCW